MQQFTYTMVAVGVIVGLFGLVVLARISGDRARIRKDLTARNAKLKQARFLLNMDAITWLDYTVSYLDQRGNERTAHARVRPGSNVQWSDDAVF